MKGLKCICGSIASYKKSLRLNKRVVDGWICNKCGEIYYNPEKAERILIANKYFGIFKGMRSFTQEDELQTHA